MSTLAHDHCEACSSTATPVAAEQIDELLRQLPGWRLEIRENVRQLEKTFTFKNFSQALEFTNAVGAIAEAQNHHPAILTEWGKVTVTWWSHKLKGLHRNDFIMAAQTSEAAAGLQPN